MSSQRPEIPPLVLVVDDEDVIVDALADTLEDEGYRVQRARDGREALALIEQIAPDLVLSDVRMPYIDGLTLVHRLRERGLPIPVVLMSAHYAGIDLPDVAFVPKPFDLDQLLAVIARAAGRG